MKWVLLDLAIAAAAFFAWGSWSGKHATNPDDMAGSAIPWIIGAGSAAIDIVCGIGWAIWAIART